uniref:Uncharacterized protein n=1 Tax=uncultured marine virus TaxID=186617 RepID=A0A0F7L4C6_9VIRU|nr:hypothetical protein [uncultured marine virus]
MGRGRRCLVQPQWHPRGACCGPWWRPCDGYWRSGAVCGKGDGRVSGKAFTGA